MKILDIVLVVLLFAGGVILWISFTDKENVVGLWSTGRDFRTQHYRDSEKFKKRTYLILRIVGFLMVIPSCLLLWFLK
jgi:hypothetical protein